MSTPLIDKSFEGMLAQMRREITLLWRRIGKSGATPTHGTTAERDALFGVPASDPARVELANAMPVWFNTDFGWWESYYAVSGLAGLAVQGLVAGTASAWYPVGLGPSIRLVPNGAQAVAGSGQRITAWAAPGTGSSRRRGGAGYFTYTNGFITIVRSGVYRVHAHTLIQAGAGTVLLYVIGSVSGNLGVQSTTLNGTWATTNSIDVAEVYLQAGDVLRYTSESGAYALNQGGDGSLATAGEFAIRYLRPSLVSV